MSLLRLLRALGAAHLVLGALVAALVLTEPTARRYGDRLQVALPLLAWGCAATGRQGGEFALRYAAMAVTVRASKHLLGGAAINRRPTGEAGGFPSTHTAAAVMGASALVQGCLRGNPAAQALVLIAAGFTGASRIATGAHTIWQVLAGALLGWMADSALRRGRLRGAMSAAVRRLAARFRRHAVRPWPGLVLGAALLVLAGLGPVLALVGD